MKKYSIIFLCLTVVTYSNANISRWKKLFLKTARYSQASWHNYKRLHIQRAANEQVMKEILACPIKRQHLLQELESLRVANDKARRVLEQAYPHLKNRN